MKNLYFIALAICIAGTACKKEATAPNPTAGFSLGNQQSSSVTVNQGTFMTLANHSTNGTSYLWDFGNGTTSTEKSPGITFDKGGNYTVSLTVKNANGTSSVEKKEVKVLVPVVHVITISDLNKWVGQDFSSLKKFTGGEVWVEITKSLKNTAYTQQPDGSFNYPLYYKSNVYKSASPDHTAPLVIPVHEKVILDGKLSSDEVRYTFNLYVKDSNGTHMLFSSDFVGSSFMPTNKWEFSWMSGFNTKVEIEGNYE